MLQRNRSTADRNMERRTDKRFENSICTIHPEIGRIKNRLYDLGAIYASMTGSGSALFGIFEKEIENLDCIFEDYYTHIV